MSEVARSFGKDCAVLGSADGKSFGNYGKRLQRGMTEAARSFGKDCVVLGNARGRISGITGSRFRVDEPGGAEFREGLRCVEKRWRAEFRELWESVTRGDD